MGISLPVQKGIYIKGIFKARSHGAPRQEGPAAGLRSFQNHFSSTLPVAGCDPCPRLRRIGMARSVAAALLSVVALTSVPGSLASGGTIITNSADFSSLIVKLHNSERALHFKGTTTTKNVTWSTTLAAGAQVHASLCLLSTHLERSSPVCMIRSGKEPASTETDNLLVVTSAVLGFHVQVRAFPWLQRYRLQSARHLR